MTQEARLTDLGENRRVFDKIPTLQVVVAESGLGWLPYFFERMEIVAKSHSNKIGLKRSPCDYFGTNFHVCYQSEPLGVESFVKTYPNNVMFASDYPHPDGVWPFSRQCAKTELANLSIDNREKVLWRNASRVFKIT